ncbi:MAG: DUF5301 domain-containing protein [Tissierellia bacterium]|nr:DUF5301 domain-containing protein [Tissierellia bacterium]
MKKQIGIILVLICMLALTACGSNKKIVLPKPDQITEIEIMKSTSESDMKIIEQDKISKIISAIKENTNNTGKESTNDQPTNIDEYITIKFNHENAEGSPSIAYLYKNKNICYVEQPYSGIWELSEEVFNSISSDLTK